MGISQHEKPNKGATDEWWTPIEIIKSLGCFDLDPCGDLRHKTASVIFDRNRGGLAAEWNGRVWLNPPYSEVGTWLDRLVNHGQGIALVFARTDTKWAQRVLPQADSVFFLSKRIKFQSPVRDSPWTAGAPSMFLSFGERPMWNKYFKGWIAK